MDAIKERSASAISGFDLFRRHQLQGLLVVAEIAMATMLFVGGGLLMHSFVKLSTVNPGYDPTHVLTFQVPFPRSRSFDAQLTAFSEDLVARLQSLSDVRAAGYAETVPAVIAARWAEVRTTPDIPQERPWAGASPEQPDTRVVSRDFLRAMGTRLIAGRGFGDQDGVGQPQVMLINQTMARSGILGENPIGKRLYADFGFTGRAPQPWEIVGIVEDVRQVGLDREPDPQIYVDFRQFPGSPSAFGPYFAVRTAGDSSSLVSSIRAIVRQLDGQATIDNVATMEQLVSNSLSRHRLYTVLLGIFAGVAVLLAAIGMYGVMAYSVAQRTREIGIRIALGARRSEVIGLVLGQGLALTAVGIASGVSGAAALTRYLDRLLFGLPPLDPPTFVTVSLVFGVIASLAAYVPARRAANVDPLVALRCE